VAAVGPVVAWFFAARALAAGRAARSPRTILSYRRLEQQVDLRRRTRLPAAGDLGAGFGVEVTEPGVIRQDGKGTALRIGEPDARTQTRVVAMTEADMCAPVRDNIRGEIWTNTING